MNRESRQHHFIPQCYLRGFATPGKGKHPQLTVFNARHGTSFPSNPRNIGGQRDFNRISIDGLHPNALESGYSDFETLLGDALARLRTGAPFTGNDKLCVLNLVALLSVRYPQMREHWRKQHEKLMKHVLEISLHSKERWEGQIAKIDELRDRTDNVTYEEMKEFFEKDQYSINLDQDYQIATELKMLDAVLPYVLSRKWTVYTSDHDRGEFITSDRPVLLDYRNVENVPPLLRDSPGFGTKDTQIIFPLDRYHALLGEFDGEDVSIDASSELVGYINSMICLKSFECFYSPSRTITYVASGALYRDSYILDRIFKHNINAL